MDGEGFDRLCRSVVGAGSRRQVLAILAGGLPSFLPLTGLVHDTHATRKRRPAHQRHQSAHDSHQAHAQKKKKKCAAAGQAPSKKRKACCTGLVLDGSGVCVSLTLSPPSPPPPSPPSPPPPGGCVPDCQGRSCGPDGCGGQCGPPCKPGGICDGTACHCPSGWTECATACANLNTDPTHCGDCLTSCGSGDVCMQQQCCRPLATTCIPDSNRCCPSAAGEPQLGCNEIFALKGGTSCFVQNRLVCCAALGQLCSHTCECCLNFACGELGRCCVATGDVCTAHAQCCSQVCDFSRSQCCNPAGAACSDHSECCSQFCNLIGHVCSS